MAQLRTARTCSAGAVPLTYGSPSASIPKGTGTSLLNLSSLRWTPRENPAPHKRATANALGSRPWSFPRRRSKASLSPHCQERSCILLGQTPAPGVAGCRAVQPTGSGQLVLWVHGHVSLRPAIHLHLGARLSDTQTWPRCPAVPRTQRRPAAPRSREVHAGVRAKPLRVLPAAAPGATRRGGSWAGKARLAL